MYLHNFSNFDSIFLRGALYLLTDKIDPIIRDNRIIDLKLNFGEAKTKYSLYFRDSYLLIPASLEKLAIAFNVEHKGMFPHLFVNNINIPLDYISDVPTIDTFIWKKNPNLSVEENEKLKQDKYNAYYDNYKNNKWSLANESRIYFEQDVITLY